MHYRPQLEFFFIIIITIQTVLLFYRPSSLLFHNTHNEPNVVRRRFTNPEYLYLLKHTVDIVFSHLCRQRVKKITTE